MTPVRDALIAAGEKRLSKAPLPFGVLEAETAVSDSLYLPPRRRSAGRRASAPP